MSSYEELAQRLGSRNGHLCLGKVHEVSQAICLVLDLLEELKDRPDTEDVFGTSFSVKEAREDNGIFGQIIFLRQIEALHKPS